MKVADKKYCSSIAFPAFGTGRLEYPPYEVAKVMFETVDMYGKLTPSTQIKEVRILVFFGDERNSKVR
jgi:O-acetyl-ADP-ribose deacetylase (regulator of RNase III)